MKTVDIIRRAGRSLRNAKARTFLTSLAIGVGAFTLTVALAAGEGARQYTETLLTTNIDPQILAVAKEKEFFEGGQTGPQEYDPDVSLQVRGGGRSIALLNQEDVDSIAARDDIVSTSPVYVINADYITAKGSKKYTVEVQQYDSGVTQSVIAGSLPGLRTDIKDSQIALPESYVELLGFDSAQQAIGEEVTVRLSRTSNITESDIQKALASGGTKALRKLGTSESKSYNFEIVAIVGRASTSLVETTSAQVSDSLAKQMSDYSTQGTSSYQKYQLVAASVKDGVSPADVKAELIEEGFGVQTAKDLQSLLFTIVNTLQGIVIGFGALALITSVFGIINTQYISVLERTREIGLMKALGMRGRHVSRLFQFEAAWIGFLGGVIGATIAVVLGTAMNPWITKTLELGDGNYLLIFQPIPIVVLIIGLMLVAMFAGLLPARKAAKLDPIEALRTE